MRRLGRFLGRLILFVLVAVALLWVFGPYEDDDLTAHFDDKLLDGGAADYLAKQEARFDDITPGVEKQIIWAGVAEVQTPWSVVYLHGFSASSQEIRPVPDDVARNLGANLIFTRLRGHGRDGPAMAEPSVNDWMQDTAEALAIARKLGERVLVISTSTGGTLAAAAAVDDALSTKIAGIVFVSPNLGINTPLEPLLTFPAARYWLPVLAGAEREFEPASEAQGAYWTTAYPSVAALPMAALVKKVAALDYAQTQVPALFWFSHDDKVVRPDVTAAIAQKWGGPVEVVNPVLGASDDPSAHVIAGDIMSPSQNGAMIGRITTWAKGL